MPYVPHGWIKEVLEQVPLQLAGVLFLETVDVSGANVVRGSGVWDGSVKELLISREVLIQTSAFAFALPCRHLLHSLSLCRHLLHSLSLCLLTITLTWLGVSRHGCVTAWVCDVMGV